MEWGALVSQIPQYKLNRIFSNSQTLSMNYRKFIIRLENGKQFQSLMENLQRNSNFSSKYLFKFNLIAEWFSSISIRINRIDTNWYRCNDVICSVHKAADYQCLGRAESLRCRLECEKANNEKKPLKPRIMLKANGAEGRKKRERYASYITVKLLLNNNTT